MKIPSKVISYKDSSFSKYSGMLQLLLQREYTPLSLNEKETNRSVGLISKDDINSLIGE